MQVPDPGGVRPARFVRRLEFLEPDGYETLLAHVAERADRTRASSTVDPRSRAVQYDDAVRRSRLVDDIELVWPLFERRLADAQGEICDALGIPRFEAASIERQLTVHGDGDFFQVHRDENQPGTDGSRVLTFVYYFHDDPKPFEGGELRVYDAVVTPRGRTIAADTYTDLDPVANSIVFFAADTFHEVLPVQMVDHDARIGRCTLNGWFHAGDLGRPAMPFVEAEARMAIAPRLLPRLTTDGVTVRATPEPVQQRLVAIRDLWERAGVAAGTGDDTRPDVIPIGPFGDEVLSALLPVAEEWAGTALHPVVASPLRIHRAGQQVAKRIGDPATDIVTALLVVAQDLDRSWPLELEIDGTRRTVALAPGEMALFEAAAIPHGLPTALPGRWCCSMLVHYRPVEWRHDGDTLIRRALSDGLIDDSGALTDGSAPLV